MIIIKNIPESNIKIRLPDVLQEKNYSCGASSLNSVLNYFNKSPLDEKRVRKELKMKNTGTDPYQIKRVLKNSGLKFKEYREMNIAQLKKCIDDKKPVMIMLQAWGNKKKYKTCKYNCKDGHWIIAIGYNDENFYFEDPSLFGTIGYIKTDSLDDRWHDIESYSPGDKKVHFTDHYGLAIWGNEIKEKTVRVRKIL